MRKKRKGQNCKEVERKGNVEEEEKKFQTPDLCFPFVCRPLCISCCIPIPKKKKKTSSLLKPHPFPLLFVCLSVAVSCKLPELCISFGLGFRVFFSCNREFMASFVLASRAGNLLTMPSSHRGMSFCIGLLRLPGFGAHHVESLILLFLCKRDIELEGKWYGSLLSNCNPLRLSIQSSSSFRSKLALRWDGRQIITKSHERQRKTTPHLLNSRAVISLLAVIEQLGERHCVLIGLVSHAIDFVRPLQRSPSMRFKGSVGECYWIAQYVLTVSEWNLIMERIKTCGRHRWSRRSKSSVVPVGVLSIIMEH